MNQTTIASYFQADHDRLDNLFKQFQSEKSSGVERAKPFFRDFKFGLQRHIIWEEEILFPIFESKTGMKSAGPTEVMRLEHQQIKQYLEKIHETVRSGQLQGDQYEFSLLQVLADHNFKEENILYPSIDQITSGEEKNEIFRKMEEIPEERYKTCCGGHVHK